MKSNQPFRPGPFAEQQIIKSILRGQHPPGSSLPAERRLAQSLGVTRPTIREALQRLENEGWIRIRHGKATMVNNFWKTGGLRLLGTILHHGSTLPAPIIEHLLKLRVIFTPPIACLAVENAPETIAAHLEQYTKLADEALAFSEFDWRLQELMAEYSGNPVHLMLLNDFRSIFQSLATAYFRQACARHTSLGYYKNLHEAVLHNKAAVEEIVKTAMQQSITIWKETAPAGKEGENVPMERLGR
ncbi:MAG: fatty acid metabolism transcriptional regulator FadR [Desulfosalsimonadaceae bacterium]